MLYDFNFVSGSDFPSSYSPLDDANIEASFGGSLTAASNLVSGIHYTLLSINGQTFVEQTAVIEDVTEIPNSYLNSGDYYFRSGENYKSVSFNSNLNPNDLGAYSAIYDIKDNFIEPPVGSGATAITKTLELSGQMQSRFSNRMGSITGLSSFDYFLNGQKIYTGISGSYVITGASPYFNLQDSTSGKIFAIPKKTRNANLTGINADIFGTKFVETTMTVSLNGVRLHPDNWLELHTGVSIVETGLQSALFSSPIETENITL